MEVAGTSKLWSGISEERLGVVRLLFVIVFAILGEVAVLDNRTANLEFNFCGEMTEEGAWTVDRHKEDRCESRRMQAGGRCVAAGEVVRPAGRRSVDIIAMAHGFEGGYDTVDGYRSLNIRADRHVAMTISRRYYR
jgi:hypothetical protein